MLNQLYLINKSIKKTFGFGKGCSAWLYSLVEEILMNAWLNVLTAPPHKKCLMNGCFCHTVNSIVSAAKLNNEKPPTRVQPLLISLSRQALVIFNSHSWLQLVVGISLIMPYSRRRERCFPSCGRGFLRDLDLQTRSRIRKRTRPQTMSSASSFQTASRSLVRFPWETKKQINMSSAHRPLQTVFLWKCYSLFVTVAITHPPHLTSSLSLQPSGQSPSKTGTLVVPKRSCSCPEESPSLTGSSCNTVKPRLVCPSVSLPRFNSLPLNILLACRAPLATFIDVSHY